jgi:sulfate/thiosulfate transport system substrate-binding protein
MSRWRQKWWHWIGLFGMGWLLVMLAACTPTIEITLVSNSVSKAAYQQITDKFAEEWHQQHPNQNVSFNQSYGASGSQTRAVIDGLEADVVALALQPDVAKIQKAGLIEAGWESEFPNDSTVAKTVAAIITQPGNPKNIKSWADLTQPGLKIVTTNPKSSGAARWTFLAIWGGLPQATEAEIQKVYQNATVLAKDAREASDVFFKQGQGDVLITYENEAILIDRKGEPVTYISPPTNISINFPIAMVDANVNKHKNRSVVEAFVKYLFTPAAQQEFAKVGFRPIVSAVQAQFAQQYQPVKDLFSVDKLGGWKDAQQKFFANGAMFDRIETNLKK